MEPVAACPTVPAADQEEAMLKALRFVRTWFLVSVPVGLFIGKFIRAGKGHPPHDRPRR